MENVYKVKDLYEAALLYSKNLPLVRLEWEGKQCFFVFEDRGACERLSNEFWKGGLMVDSMEYAISIRKLKDRIFSQK